MGIFFCKKQMSLILLILAYTLLASLFYVEYHYESRRTTTTLETAGDDRGTTRLLFIVYFLVIVFSLLFVVLFDAEDTTTTSAYISWVGLPLMLMAIILLRWTTLTNPFYLRSMSTTDDHYICTDGPYKTIRHPGYCAFLIAWTGFAIIFGNWISFLLIFMPILCVYLLRIQAEEQMMLDRFGVDYQQYMYETYR